MLVWYSQEARSYALLVLLSSASLLFFVRALDSFALRDVAGWGAASALALATHYFIEALQNDELIHEAPAIVGRQTPSALEHAASD